MSYYSEIEFKTTIKKDRIKEFNKFVRKRIKELPDGNVSEHLQNISGVDEFGDISLDEYDCKWYHEVDFILEILPFLQNGNILFRGEDNEMWGYEIHDGKLYSLSIVYSRGDEIIKVNA